MQRSFNNNKSILYEGKTLEELVEILDNDWQGWKEVDIKIETR